MKHRVERDGDDLSITVEEAEGHTEGLMEAFRECQEGRCTCPTHEYEKLDKLEVSSDGGTVPPRCPYCEKELPEVYFKGKGVPFASGRNLVFFCPHCSKVLGVGHGRMI